jgi:hypothetical protein
MPEKSWLFDFRAMSQSNYQTQSTRQIKRISTKLVASTTNSISNSVASAALPHSSPAHDSAVPSDHLIESSAIQQASASSGTNQSKGATVDLGAAIGKLAVAAKGIPIDIVYSVYVRKGENVAAANELLAQIGHLHGIFANKFSFAEVDAAMIASSDSHDAALEMLQQLLHTIPEEAPDAPADSAPAPAASVAQEEKASCIICWANAPSHAFIPCGHKHICSECNGDPAVISALDGKCPFCSAPFSRILQIFEG